MHGPRSKPIDRFEAPYDIAGNCETAGRYRSRGERIHVGEALSLVAYPDLESRVDAIERDGYVYFPDQMRRDEVAEMRETMDRLEANPEHDTFDTPESGGFYHVAIHNAFNRDRLFTTFLDRPGVIEVAEAIHGADCHCIGMTVWITGPGRPAQKLHVDWLPIALPEDVRRDPRVKMPVFITTCHYYLNDMYEELGPTQFVPGSHFSGRRPNGGQEGEGKAGESILCSAGDAVLFRSEVWHRGTANVSEETRYLLQVHYAQRMITQKYPPYPHRFRFDEALLAQATPRQRRLMGDHLKSNYD